jgi:RHS repeat-associated protein
MRVTPRFVPILLALCLPGAVAAAQTPVAFPAGLEELWEGGDRCGEPRAEQWAWTFGMDYRLAAEVASRAKVIPYRFIVEDLVAAAEAKAATSTPHPPRPPHLRSGAPPAAVGVGTGGSPNIFGFTGHEMDSETGLIYMKARFYDPRVGLFLSEDPFEGSIFEPASLHRYLYAYANPTVYVDPDGRCVGKLQQTDFCQSIARGMEFVIAGDPEARTDEEIEKREKVLQGRREFRERWGREPRPDEVVWWEGGRALTADFREIDISGRIEPDHAEWTIVGGGIGTRMAVSSARAAGATTAKQVVAGLTQLGDEAVGELTGIGPRDVVDLGRLARERLAPRPPGGAGSGPSEVTLVTEGSAGPGVELRPLSDPLHRPSRSVDQGTPAAGTEVPSGGAANVAKGRAAEEAVSDAIGVPRNAGPGRVTVPGSGRGGFRIPDFPPQVTIRMRGSIVEVKDIQGLAITPQLRDLAAFAQSRGAVLEIFTSAPVPVRGALADLIGSGVVRVKPLP